MFKIQSFGMGVLVGGLALAVAGEAAAQSVTGAGGSFPAPLYARWAADYQKATGVEVNYQSVGSGAGIQQIKARTVDFGASDMPLKDDELAAGGLMEFPTVVGGIVPVVNVPGVKPGELKLTGALLADIYLGKITRWNDARLTALNPSVKLPDLAIAPVRRADGSGTTFGFTHYLSQVSPEWKEKVGEGTAVNWLLGTGGKGNEGVSAFVGRLNGSIGYVEYAYAKQNRMTHAQMENAAGKFVEPSIAAFKAATSGADWRKSFYQVLTNQPGAESWPITSATFILIPVKADKPDRTSAVFKFFDWTYKNGDGAADALEYVPLPAEVKTLVRERAWSQVKDGAGKAVAY